MIQLNEQSKPIKKSGYMLPWDADAEQPCLILIEDVEFIAVFSDEVKLHEHLELMKYKCKVTIKLIHDTDEFLDSVQPFRVALNPWITERFTTRFTEIKTTK
jgi:hypothetical protein